MVHGDNDKNQSIKTVRIERGNEQTKDLTRDEQYGKSVRTSVYYVWHLLPNFSTICL